MHSSGIFRKCTTRFKPSTRSSTRTFRGNSFINTIYDRHYSQSKPEQPPKADVIEELEKRGLIAQVTSSEEPLDQSEIRRDETRKE
ncbi:tyrosyl-tRNA synthetase [Puccinia graminis f. sp. tritici]|uniref:Tyrosyl-tRNA synthetase n=1 Tax=Puccinia graminis f. sp. tritici TaxID=56615 RepID=A0A5B0SFJ4_PUCGR|nr:tyrosyl-tRNA synthetase [Puccinia graminis f. sp. tritici]